jgi:multidrug efflux pump subunit AcrA (membrane-fusion protein)
MRLSKTFGPTYLFPTLVAITLVGCSFDQPVIEPESDTTLQAAETLQPKILELGEQARKNLHLVVKPARPTDYWRTVSIPGVVADRPGISDRGVTSPAVGIVSEIHVYPGDTVSPGQRLVTVRLLSEYLQATQTQLFKSAHEATLVQSQIDRLGDAAIAGAISGSRLIELKNEQQRQQMMVRAAKQELLNRGLSAEQIDAVSQGNFVSSVEVVAPPPRADSALLKDLTQQEVQTVNYEIKADVTYEVQSLPVELGQTVQAGEMIISLANHQSLYVVGHAFKREAGLIEQAAQNGTPVEIGFAEDSAELWPPLDQQFQIRHFSNTIDVETRTFDFFVPLRNQLRTYEKEGTQFLVWRFRPGQRTRIEVPVQKFTNVFVVPSEAAVREGPDAFVYRQNGDLFNQIAVHVLHEDRRNIVIANDGSITPGTYLAQNAAASLRRVLKSQSASGMQPGMHVHADGTVHAAH